MPGGFTLDSSQLACSPSSLRSSRCQSGLKWLFTRHLSRLLPWGGYGLTGTTSSQTLGPLQSSPLRWFLSFLFGTVTVNGAAGHNRGGVVERRLIDRTRQDRWLFFIVQGCVCVFQATPGIGNGVGHNGRPPQELTGTSPRTGRTSRATVLQVTPCGHLNGILAEFSCQSFTSAGPRSLARSEPTGSLVSVVRRVWTPPRVFLLMVVLCP